MSDLRCYSLHFFFRIKDAEIYGGIGTTGYAEMSIDKAVNIEDFTAERFEKTSENLKNGLAEQLKVPIENVTAIDRNEYEEATKDDGDLAFDED